MMRISAVVRPLFRDRDFRDAVSAAKRDRFKSDAHALRDCGAAGESEFAVSRLVDQSHRAASVSGRSRSGGYVGSALASTFRPQDSSRSGAEDATPATSGLFPL